MRMERYHPANWFTLEGQAKKRKLIESRGVPNLKNWRFLTLTLDQSLFEGPLSAYFTVTDNFSRRIKSVCEAMGKRDARWCCKMEFQENGWVHFHLAVDIRSKLSFQCINKDIPKAWSFGRTDVQRIESGRLSYFFKYVFKCPLTKLEATVPDWFDSYEKDGKTLMLARFWRVSKSFYTGPKKKTESRPEPETCKVYYRPTLIINRLKRMARIKIEGKSKVVQFNKVDWREMYHIITINSCYGFVRKLSDFRGWEAYKINSQALPEIEKHINKWQIQQVKNSQRALSSIKLKVLTEYSDPF